MNRQEQLEQYAERLRASRTKSEAKFAGMLAEHGVRFEEQKVVGGYIADFYFPAHDLRIVELDGKCHRDQKEKDVKRDAKLRELGHKILRVRSQDVFIQPRWLMHRVLMFLKEPHEPVPRALRKSRRQINNKLRPRKTPAWAKVKRLDKNHLPIGWTK